jgi:hypothetical protein
MAAMSMSSSKRKRRIVLNIFGDEPLYVSRKEAVDADNWRQILESVETWKGEVLGRDLF